MMNQLAKSWAKTTTLAAARRLGGGVVASRWMGGRGGSRFASTEGAAKVAGVARPEKWEEMTLPSGIPGWRLVVEENNGKFSHGGHLLHDTLRAAGGANDVHHFISEKLDEVLMVLSAGQNVCGHKEVLHGGFVATLFDNAFATLGFVNMKFPVTKDLSLRYLSPIQAGSNLLLKGRLIVDGAPLSQDKKGRQVRFFEGALFEQSQFSVEKLGADGGKDVTAADEVPRPLVVAHAQMVDVGDGKLPVGWKP